MLESISTFLTFDNIIKTIPFFVLLFAIYQYRKSKNKIRPSIPTVEIISDEYGRRLLLTVISNNPNGSELLRKPLLVEKLPRELFCKRNIIALNYIPNKDFLSPKIHYDSIPNWLIKGQESFVAILNDNQLNEEGTYKITFYTKDGSCSYILSGYFGNMAQLFEHI